MLGFQQNLTVIIFLTEACTEYSWDMCKCACGSEYGNLRLKHVAQQDGDGGGGS